MCTAITYQTKDHYFGRNLDLDHVYRETVTITPRRYPLGFRQMGIWNRHYAMIGMAYVLRDYPLYYDATNEAGLSMAGLNFPGNAVYRPEKPGRDNVSPFEFIPWVLGQCATISETRALLERINLWDVPFHPELPLAPLHWMISDRSCSIVVEAVKEGLRVYDNPAEVLTNNPPFDYQMTNLSNYLHLTPWEPENHFSSRLDLSTYCKGMGALGLPGDLSSVSRFVRAAFTRLNAVSGHAESESVSQFFHILGSVAQSRGCVRLGEDRYETTVYSSCCNTSRGIYYYTTYENNQITAVDLHGENLEGTRLVSYPLVTGQQIRMQNGNKTRKIYNPQGGLCGIKS